MGLWRSTEAQEATGGQATRPFGCLGISADINHLAPGEMFVAFDPDQARAAFDLGAGAVMATRMGAQTSVADPYLIVSDLSAALVAMAAYVRGRIGGRIGGGALFGGARVVAIAGSLGKSTALSMVAHVMGRVGRVETLEASTLLGLAIRLAHLGPRGFAPNPFVAAELPVSGAATLPVSGAATPLVLVEIDPLGAADPCALLQMIAPDYLFVTAAGGAEDLAALMPPERLILPYETCASHPEGARFYGQAQSCDPRLISARMAQEVTVIEALHQGHRMLMKLRYPAPQVGGLALGVLALVTACGVDPAVAALDLGQWEAPEGQGLRERIYMDYVDAAASFDLFDVTAEHNESLPALVSDLATLAASHPRDGVGRLRRGRRIAILGGAAALPSALAQAHILRRIDRVHCFGAGGEALWAALPETRRGQFAADATGLCARAAHLLDAGDVVMVRGDVISGAKTIVEALKRLGQPGAAEAHGAQRGTE